MRHSRDFRDYHVVWRPPPAESLLGCSEGSMALSRPCGPLLGFRLDFHWILRRLHFLLSLSWTSTGPLQDLYGISARPRMDPYWISTAPLMDLDWTSSAHLLDIYSTSTGLLLDLYWASSGLLLGFHLISTGTRLDLLLGLY